MNANIPVDQEKIAEFCRRRRIRKLAFFGSVLRNDFRSDSDVDVLVEFEQGEMPGLRIFDIEAELSELLNGRKVDLIREKYLNRHLRDRVLTGAEIAYAEG